MSRQFLLFWLGLSLGLHILAAIFSTGYQNSDEHFQILEFLNYKLGNTPSNDLAIEFHRMMRPWFQPALYYFPTLCLKALGIHNPFTWAMGYRMVSALIGWISVVCLALATRVWIKEIFWQKVAVIVMALTWYLPAFHARHSSENLSGALLTIAVALFALGNGKKMPLRHGLGLGLLLGLAFEVRYQVIFMIAGWCFWRLLVSKDKLQALVPVFVGGAFAVVLGTLLDAWGYGHLTFAPWNYFSYNILEGNLDAGGISPWWDYFRRVWTESWPVLAPLYLFGMIWGWVRYPRHVLTWTLAPLFIAHLLIAHKETRFLFPMAHAAPLVAVMGFQCKRQWTKRWRVRVPLAVFALFNGFALLILCFTPASMPIRLYEFVYANEIKELRYLEGDPYVLLGIPMYFYRPAGLITKLGEPPGAGWLYYSGPKLLSSNLSKRCRREFSIYPEWLRENDPRGLLKHVNDGSLFRCISSYSQARE